MIELLQSKFKDIKYLDSKHQYFTTDGVELQSVTQFLSSLKPKFNSRYWSINKAYTFSGYKVKTIWNDFFKFILLSDEEGAQGTYVYLDDDHSHLLVTPEDVLNQWNLDSLVGRTRGSYLHDYLDKLESRVLDIPHIEIPNGLETGQAINYFNSLKAAQELCLDYVEYAQENLILVAAEFIIGDPKIGLAGRFDRLYFNKSTKKYEIWDFKTDKQIRYKSSFGNLNLVNLPDCEFEKYSLQTSIYKKMIQDTIGVELGDSRIVWFNLKENKWEILVCKDYISLINTLNLEDTRKSYQ